MASRREIGVGVALIALSGVGAYAGERFYAGPKRLAEAEKTGSPASPDIAKGGVPMQMGDPTPLKAPEPPSANRFQLPFAYEKGVPYTFELGETTQTDAERQAVKDNLVRIVTEIEARKPGCTKRQAFELLRGADADNNRTVTLVELGSVDIDAYIAAHRR